MSNVEEYLLKGKSNAISRQELAELFGTSDRSIRLMIQERREHGIPILSSCDNTGYYLPADGEMGESECRKFIAQQRSRARMCFISARGAKKYLHEHNQITM